MMLLPSTSRAKRPNSPCSARCSQHARVSGGLGTVSSFSYVIFEMSRINGGAEQCSFLIEIKIAAASVRSRSEYPG